MDIVCKEIIYKYLYRIFLAIPQIFCKIRNILINGDSKFLFILGQCGIYMFRCIDLMLNTFKKNHPIEKDFIQFWVVYFQNGGARGATVMKWTRCSNSNSERGCLHSSLTIGKSIIFLRL